MSIDRIPADSPGVCHTCAVDGARSVTVPAHTELVNGYVGRNRPIVKRNRPVRSDMNVDRRTIGRLAVAVCVVTSVLFVGTAYANRHDSVVGPTATSEVGDRVAPASNGTTVVTTQGSIPQVELPRSAIRGANGAIYVVGSDGRLRYKNTTYHAYFDVDPIENARATVEYVAYEFVSADDCDTEYHCYVRHVERVNVTTGEVRSVYTERHAETGEGVDDNEGRWHDVDRDGSDRLLIADIETNAVRLLNTTTGIVEWEWRAAGTFPVTGGGDYMTDWTHVNDVERLPDGRVMASLRNQDQIVFVDPETGLQENWTLGADDRHDVLYEQHNPDYVPEARGGPAVVVADSENDRIVEYQRRNGEWVQSWVWRDETLYWPRDADRLPTGNTLVTDTRADRIAEVDESGDVVWRMDVERPYEAERLDTGDESVGGESAARLGSASRTPEQSRESTGVRTIVLGVVPGVIRDAIAFFAPPWMGFVHIGVTAATLGLAAVWIALEYWWSDYAVRVRVPVRLSRE